MPEIITLNDALYAFDIVKAICTQVGPGLPGSPQERERAAMIKVDPFFKKKQSVNVIGTLRRPGTKNVRRLLILSGHHDSAPENTWLGFLGYGFFFLSATWMIGFITMLAMSILQLVGVVAGNADIVRIGTLGWVLLAYPIIPSVIFGMFFNRGRKNGGSVPGAADNLSASALGSPTRCSPPTWGLGTTRVRSAGPACKPRPCSLSSSHNRW